MPAIHISVIEAFLLSGFRNAGTPLETASTPDSATAPDENARSSISNDSAPVWRDRCSASSLRRPSATISSTGIGPRCCTNTRYRPTAISMISMTM